MDKSLVVVVQPDTRIRPTPHGSAVDMLGNLRDEEESMSDL